MANYNLAQLQQLSREAGWPEHLIAKAAAIWMYESSGNPKAHNPRGENSWGLAQINLPFHPTMTVAKACDPLTALRYAYELYKARPDWGDWYNSNKSYNANARGIAAQSRAIYASGSSGATIGTSAVSNLPAGVGGIAASIGTLGMVAIGVFAVLLLTDD